MSSTGESIPRSTMTVQQQRRIGALQAAKVDLYGNGYQTVVVDVDDLLRVSDWIAEG